MKKFLFIALVSAAMLAFSGCACYSADVQGGVFDGHTTTKASVVQAEGTVGTKVGEAKAYGVLGIAAWGDDSITAAAKAGGIKKIGTVDKKILNILGIWQMVTTIVTGE
jgi:hypothetical protein